jgi:Mce-associated membrane protein
MATKLTKRTNTKDVFDKVVEEHDPPSAEMIENTTDAVDSETSEAADSTPSVEDADTGEARDGETDGADEQPSTPSRRKLWLRRFITPRVENADTVDAQDDEAQDDEAQDDDTDGADKQPRTPSRPKRWLRRFIAGAAGIIFVAALGLSGFLGWQLEQQTDVNDAGRAALAAAQSYAVALTSIDTNSVDKNFTQVVDGATGEFKDMYSQSAGQLRQVLIDNKAMSKGVVIDSAIKSATKTKVDVVLFIDQWISNVVSPQPRMDRSRVAMTMELIDGRWLASKVELK